MGIIGISRKPIEGGLMPLEHQIRFRSHSSAADGYFFLIAPPFQEFVLHGEDIEGLHVLARSAGSSLQRSLAICAEVETIILNNPDKWRDVLGTIKQPGRPERPHQPLIVRRRALAILSRIRRLFETAQSEEAEVIFGNGAFFIPLSGIELPPGVEYYS